MAKQQQQQLNFNNYKLHQLKATAKQQELNKQLSNS